MSTKAVPIVGISLGHRHERTAISVTERAYVPTGEQRTIPVHRGFLGSVDLHDEISVEYRVRHLERQGPPSRYKRAASRVSEVFREIGQDCYVVVDMTATGNPGFSLIFEELRRVREEGRIHPTLCPLTVSGIAGGVSKSPDVGYLVPRRDLISVTQIVFDEGQLKIAEGLKLARTLTDELLAFKPKADKPDDLEGWRERPHDDLVLAVAISVWAAERFFRKEDSVPAGTLTTA